MRKSNKIVSIVIAFTMLISMFSMITVSAASLDGLKLTYTFADGSAKGVADGTVTISGITSDLQSAITNVNIYWGKSSTEALDGYYNLKYYTVLGYYKEDGKTVDETAANSKNTKLAYADEALTYVLSGNMAIPNGATHLIAEVVTADTTKSLSVEIPEEKLFNHTSENLKYAMIWGSDIHLKKDSALSGSRARKAVQGAVAVSDLYGDKFKGMIINGDIADTAKDYEYSMAEQFYRDYGVDFPIYYSNGNHDTIMFSNGVNKYDECEKAMQYRFDKLEKDFGITFDSADFWSYETTIGGHHYIFFASPLRDLGVNLTDARKAWLEEKISMYEKSGEPTFIFTHYPYTGKLSRYSAGFTFDDILERHPSVTVITSHVHMELNSDFITTNISTTGGNNFLDTSSLSYTNNLNSATRYVPEGRVVEVYDDAIILKAMDFSNNQWIPRGEHILNVNGTKNPFVGDFSIASSAAEGTIEAGTLLTAKLNGSDIPEGYTVTWYDMLGTELGTGSTYTVTTANASIGAKIVKADDNSYARAVARYIAPVEDDGEGDEEGGDTPSVEITGDATVKYYGEVVNISGSVGTDFAEQEATIVLAPRATYSDLSTAKYVGNCTIDAEGNYSFKFKAGDVSQSDVFMIKVGTSTVSINQVVARTNEEIVEVTPTLDAENKLSLSIKNMLADTRTATLIFATYDENDKLIEAKPVEYSLAFNENFDLQTYAGDTTLTGEYARVYMWTNLSDLVPLSDSDKVEIPELSTETAQVSE